MFVYGVGKTGDDVTSEHETLSEALRRMPTPPLRAGFVDAALARAVAASDRREAPSRLRAFGRWETWMGAALGAALAMMATVFVMRPEMPVAPAAGITLAMNESRNVEVLIDSERTLDDATIRIATTGSVELDGFDDARAVEWQTRLERGRNVLSLPVVARTEGAAQLVAVIEHEGRSRRIAINLVVTPRANRGNV